MSAYRGPELSAPEGEEVVFILSGIKGPQAPGSDTELAKLIAKHLEKWGYEDVTIEARQVERS